MDNCEFSKLTFANLFLFSQKGIGLTKYYGNLILTISAKKNTGSEYDKLLCSEGGYTI